MESRRLDRRRQIRDLAQRTLDLTDRLAIFLASEEPEDWTAWQKSLDALKRLSEQLEKASHSPSQSPTMPLAKLQAFGKLLRDLRNAAGLSRVELARLAKMSDATIKFAETARHPPSRGTLLRLCGVKALKLNWSDLPVEVGPPPAEIITAGMASSTPPEPWARADRHRITECLAALKAGLEYGAVYAKAAEGSMQEPEPLATRMLDESWSTTGFLADRSLTQLCWAIDQCTSAVSGLPTDLWQSLRNRTLPFLSADLVAVAQAFVCASRRLSAQDFCSILAASVEKIDCSLALAIYQIPVWAGLPLRGALGFAEKAPACRHWVVAALYGFIQGGGNIAKSKVYAAVLATRSDLSAAFAAGLTQWVFWSSQGADEPE